MLTKEQEKELERQMEEASAALLLLLLAERPDVKLPKNVRFDRRRAVFVVEGRKVSDTTLRILLAQIEKIGEKRVLALLKRLENGQITVETWRRQMADLLKVSHLMAGALALGGLDNAMRSNEVSNRTNAEIAYLAAFAGAIQANQVSFNKARARAKSYMLAVPVTFYAVEQNVKQELKDIRRSRTGIVNAVLPVYTEARRFRRARESCASCIAASGFWMPIEKMPPIGSLECRSKCRCFIRYR